MDKFVLANKRKEEIDENDVFGENQNLYKDFKRRWYAPSLENFQQTKLVGPTNSFEVLDLMRDAGDAIIDDILDEQTEDEKIKENFRKFLKGAQYDFP